MDGPCGVICCYLTDRDISFFIFTVHDMSLGSD